MTKRKSFDSAGVQFGWDATSITLAQTCLRKYQLSMILGWEPARKSIHLQFGGHYATALEHFYKHRAEGDTIDIALRKVVHEALIATWDTEHGGSNLPDDSKKNRFTLIRTIVWYIEEFGEEKEGGITTHHLADGRPAVELSFALEITDDVVFCGHMDRIVNYAGGQYGMDQKTTGTTISPRFFEGFSPDVQMSMYTFAGKVMFDTPIKGMIIDGAQIAVGFTRFERGFTTRTQDQLDEWYENSMHTIRGAQEATRTGFFPMNTTACGNYGGCEFRRICSRSPGTRENFLRGDFKQTRMWDPLERR